MKFSYRLITALVLVGTIAVGLLYWKKDLTDKITLSLRDEPSVTSDEKTSLRITEGKVQHATASVDHAEECTKGSSRVEAEIDTYSIIHNIDTEQPAKKDGRRVAFRDTRQAEKAEFEPSASKTPLKVILVPHSHNDPGWHKTVDGYFQDQTKPTLDNMVEKLTKFPNMTFIWAESVFLHMWYEDLPVVKQEQVKHLIKRGQLEIVVGSWVVPDEANPHYLAVVDQMIEGHQWLERTLNVKPKNTWSLDPFGYSSTLPYLYKRAGFENMVILRVHEKLKNDLQNRKALEFFWRQHWDREHSNDIFTLMMPYMLYNIKHSCGPDHYVCLQFDFRKIPGEYSEARAEPIAEHNVERLAKLLLGQYQQKANLYKHNVVLIPLGDDFRYDRNIEWDQQFKNYMMLFNYINRRKEWNVQARFGTVQDYFDEVENAMIDNPLLKEEGFPSLQGDFFPYTDKDSEYWTGYFTTRPFDKNLGREVEVHLRAAEILNALSLGSSAKSGNRFDEFNDNMDVLSKARQNLGLFQHHDAITGTARSYVVIDYEQRLKTALDITQRVMRSSAAYLMQIPDSKSPLELDVDDAKSLKLLYPEKKVIEFSPKGTAEIVLFNSIGHEREELVKVTVNADRVHVFNEDGEEIISQINPIWKDDSDITVNKFELAFFATLSPLSMTTYKLKAYTQDNENSKNYAAYVRLYNAQEYRIKKNLRFNIMPPAGEHIILENEAYRARFSTRTGMMHSITTKSKITTTKVNMEYLMYKSRGSGAYIFNPAGPAVDTEMSTRPLIRVVRGPVLSEIQTVQELVLSTVRLCNTTGFQGKAFEINNVVDLRNKNNKELIMRLSTDMKHNETFYTDLNAFHVSKRTRFHSLPPEANYYPMSAFAYIEDEETRLSLIAAQPLGVSSQDEGALEVMLDRKPSQDDQRGLGEGIYDNKRAPSRFYLLLERKIVDSKPESVSYPSLLAHHMANTLRNHIFVFIPPVEMLNSTVHKYQAMTTSLPCDVELANLRTLDIGNSRNKPGAALILHRVGYGCGLASRSVTCDLAGGRLVLSNIFSTVQLTNIQEVTLSLMHTKSKVIPVGGDFQLKPMEIYAFKTNFEQKADDKSV